MDIERGVAEVLARYLHAYRTGDAAGCAACYLPDGAVYSPYAPPALGRQAIEDLHRDWTLEAAPNKTLDPREIGGAGRHGLVPRPLRRRRCNGRGLVPERPRTPGRRHLADPDQQPQRGRLTSARADPSAAARNASPDGTRPRDRLLCKKGDT